ncbi:MAG: hypothetical protein IKY31_07855 [Bacteroidaceae bacterium]|nr:hypothetical protein [Bacteroidaceae bacterium]
MKKYFKFMILALVAMCGFASCSEECEHNFIEVDYSKDLVGTWTCLEAGYAEALVISADGKVVSTGVENGEYWDGVKGNIKTVNNKMTLTFGDGDNYEGRFEMICGEAFTIFDENGEHLTYRYCANDLADEVVGMWVCNDGLPGEEKDFAIITYSDNGKMTMTTQKAPEAFIPVDFVNVVVDYKVVGDLKFHIVPNQSTVARIVYTPNGISFGDILTQTIHILPENSNDLVEITSTFLRVKETLALEGNKYDYIKTFVTNVDGLDKDINFMGFEFNFAKMDGVKLDKMLKTLLFTVEFPAADSIKYSCHYSTTAPAPSVVAPIEVEGNKMTIKMSKVYPTAKDVDLYTFQDADNCQLHMYLPTYSFINFFGNMQVVFMSQLGQIDITDEVAVKAVYDDIDNAVNTINVSLVMEKAK